MDGGRCPSYSHNPTRVRAVPTLRTLPVGLLLLVVASQTPLLLLAALWVLVVVHVGRGRCWGCGCGASSHGHCWLYCIMNKLR